MYKANDEFEFSRTLSAATDNVLQLNRIILSKQDAVTATNHISTNIRMLASIFLVYAFLTSYGAGVAQQRGKCEISINKK